MGTLSRIGLAALVLLGFAATASDASARHARRRRHVHVTRHFVYPSPEAARTAAIPGIIGGYFETGILGPTTADPYERPATGYDASGRLRRGYVEPSPF